MSGHSKWATIKHKKGAADAKRGKLFSKLIREITVAAKMGGGDPGGNPRLRKAISTAKGAQMPADTIDRAVKRGSGELDGVSYEEILYEGTGPSGTLWLVSAMTDNRNRTVSEIRKAFEKQNGALGGGGSAAWAFDRKGIIVVPAAGVEEDKLMEVALEAGADNYERADETWHVLCDVSSIDAVTTALETAGFKVESSVPGYVPKNKKLLQGKDAEKALSMWELLDDHDDVQAVYSDWDIAEDELQRIAAASA
jgi:YebC/PmpR family DNA-binding regulatory protein